MIQSNLSDMNIDINKVKVTRLVAKGRDVNSLSYVSFKIDTDDIIAERINMRDFWPKPCTINKFKQKSSKASDFLCSLSPHNHKT